MRAIVRRTGNDVAIQIPAPSAAAAGLIEGTVVEVDVFEGAPVIAPRDGRRPTLDELLSGLRPESIHAETVTSGVVGVEHW
jgi:antitoxin component of MazEF toxin-antitoxin module